MLYLDYMKQKIENRVVYAIEFPDNYVYVGLTKNLKNRFKQHLSPHHRSYVYKHILKTSLTPKLIKLEIDLNENDAKVKEFQYLKEYSNKNWHIINKAKPGSLGGSIIKHTKLACISDAKKYKTKREWYEKSPSSYDAARRNKWLNDCCSHMIIKRKINGYWSKNICNLESKKFTSKTEWQKKSSTSYSVARKNGWLLELSKHMQKQKKENGFWTKERCIIDAKKYNTRNNWRIKSSSASSIASKNGWLEECCSHMLILRKK